MSGMIFDYSLSYDGRVPFFGDVYYGRIDKLKDEFADPKKAKLINLQMQPQGGQTVGHVAVFGQTNVATIKFLVENGADLTLEDSSGRTILDVAANAADPEVIQYLLLAPFVKSSVRMHIDKLKRTPLHAVCMPGSSPHEKQRGLKLSASVGLILNQKSLEEQKLALATPDVFGITPLMYAKHFGYTEIISFCDQAEGLYSGEIPSIPANHPALDLDYWGRPTSGLMEAAFDKDEVKVAEILKIPTNANNPNLTNPQFCNQNALHYAVRGGTAKIVDMILQDPRTNPLAVDNFASNALHFAGARGNAAIMQMLLLNAPIKNNVNIKDVYGMTALHALATATKDQSRLDALELLIAAGADLFAKNNNGHTAYDIAKLLGNTAVAERLDAAMQPTLTQATYIKKVSFKL